MPDVIETAGQITDLLDVIQQDADQDVIYPEDIRQLAQLITDLRTVQVRVKDVFGSTTVYPANETAIRFAEVAGTKTITANTMRAIRALGYTVTVLTGELPAGW